MPARSSTSSTGRAVANSDPVRRTVSATVRSLRRPPVWRTAETLPAAMASRGARPKTRTVPLSGRANPSSMSIVVVLPAPFGPRNARTSPASTWRSSPSTARTEPNDLVRPRRSMARSVVVSRMGVDAVVVMSPIVPRARPCDTGQASPTRHDRCHVPFRRGRHRVGTEREPDANRAHIEPRQNLVPCTSEAVPRPPRRWCSRLC
ncbi:hypothetical protein GALL_411570 [mine drainage metagenome]|uniref:Uncharacterized protein n=1 Tax=mine drainage metagenome TaxID=410659 RepID=A0A1J5Q1K5_9ZZZZ